MELIPQSSFSQIEILQLASNNLKTFPELLRKIMQSKSRMGIELVNLTKEVNVLYSSQKILSSIEMHIEMI